MGNCISSTGGNHCSVSLSHYLTFSSVAFSVSKRFTYVDGCSAGWRSLSICSCIVLKIISMCSSRSASRLESEDTMFSLLYDT